MVYDTFMFFDELDLLEIRMNILDPVVDFFVITEADTTQVGNLKKMIFKDNIERFEQFKEKIIYNPINNGSIKFKDQWCREKFQKDACIKGLKKCQDDDMILFSDLDEIPNPEMIKKIQEDFNPDKIYHLAQEMFYFFFNYKNIDGSLLAGCGEFSGIQEKKWLGTKICSYRLIKEVGCDGLRHKAMINENALRIEDGGWHFSYMGGSGKKVQERIKTKLEAFSHKEYNKWRYYNKLNIWFSIKMGKDLLGRRSKFKKINIDSSYPEWLQEHCMEYPHFIL